MDIECYDKIGDNQEERMDYTSIVIAVCMEENAKKN